MEKWCDGFKCRCRNAEVWVERSGRVLRKRRRHDGSCNRRNPNRPAGNQYDRTNSRPARTSFRRALSAALLSSRPGIHSQNRRNRANKNAFGETSAIGARRANPAPLSPYDSIPFPLRLCRDVSALHHSRGRPPIPAIRGLILSLL